MSHLIRIVIFTLAVIGFYTYFANSIPQIESRPPEEITTLSAEMTPEELAELGQQIVEGKGGCLVCHSIGSPGSRAPDLAGVGARAATRIEGLSAEEYLRQSLTDPSAYVVEGYEPIMPKMDAPPTSLTPAEITAVVAYLQSLGGEITVQVPTGEELATPTEAPAQQAAALDPQTLIAKYQCGLCHVIPGVEGAVGQVGPSLAGLGERAATRVEGLTAEEYIRQSILDPNAFVVEECPAGPCAPGVMPANFGEQMTEEELETLVTFLANLKEGCPDGRTCTQYSASGYSKHFRPQVPTGGPDSIGLVSDLPLRHSAPGGCIYWPAGSHSQQFVELLHVDCASGNFAVGFFQ